MRKTAAAVLWLLIAWGVLTFGAVYAWAYTPMLVAAAAIGAYGWTSAASADRASARPFAFVLLAATALAVTQMLPLPTEWLVRLSPAADRVLREYDMTYAIARASGESPLHSLSIEPSATARGLLFISALGIFAAGTTALLPRLRISVLVRAVIALGLAVAVLGITQRATFNGRIYWIWTPVYDPVNAFGPFVNRNHFAGWMLMCTALAAGYLCAQLSQDNPPTALSARRQIARFLAERAGTLIFTAFAVLLMALSVVWTLSRSGIIGLAVALAVLGAHAGTALPGWRRLTAIAILIASLTFAVAWRGVDTVAHWYGRTETLQWRVQLWRDTLPIIDDFRWWGTGFNTYATSTLLYPMSDQQWHAREAHSDYVQIISEGGLLMAAIVASGIAVLAMGIRRRFMERQPARVRWIRAGAAAGLCGIAVQELTDFSLQLPGTALFCAFLVALALHRTSAERPSANDVAHWRNRQPE